MKAQRHRTRAKRHSIWADLTGCTIGVMVFALPFVFMLVNSLKDRRNANLLRLSLPVQWQFENYIEVFKNNNYILLTAFRNSILITIISVIVLIAVCSMAGYTLQRRKDKLSSVTSSVFLTGLMLPPAILPTIWVLQGTGLYKTLTSMIFVEVALLIPFTILLYRGFVSSIPTDIEEAGYIDGCNSIMLFTHVIFPLLKPVTATVLILNAVSVFNDFTNPLYFLPGRQNTTVQLTLYNYMGLFSSSYHLLFANVMIITIPMLIIFIIFNRKIVDGMVAGAIKG